MTRPARDSAARFRRAATSGELEMWLQSKQCLRSGRRLGMEALVRWRHPEHGYVSPAEFIPFAERTGHIGLVTTALQTLADWAPGHPDLSIAVNVSALEVREASVAGHVKQLAQKHRAPLNRLRLEITETTAIGSLDAAQKSYTHLRNLIEQVQDGVD